MKLIGTITTAALAFAAAGSAAVCTPGLNYCTRVLTDVSKWRPSRYPSSWRRYLYLEFHRR